MRPKKLKIRLEIDPTPLEYVLEVLRECNKQAKELGLTKRLIRKGFKLAISKEDREFVNSRPISEKDKEQFNKECAEMFHRQNNTKLSDKVYKGKE